MAKLVRVSKNQKTALIEHLLDNEDMFHGEITDSFTHEECERVWEELKNKLNSMRGCQKEADEWKKYWSSVQLRVEYKASYIKKSYDRPGGGYGIGVIFTPLEERVMATIWNKGILDVDEISTDFVDETNSSSTISPLQKSLPEISPDPPAKELTYYELRKKAMDLVTDTIAKSEEVSLRQQTEMRNNTAEITTKLDEVAAAIKELTAVMKEFAENQQK